MNKPILFTVALLASATAAHANPTTNAPTAPKTITIQEMLVMGHSGMKLHSLAMITQGKAKGGVDDSYLPGFKVCSEDPATPVRSVTARLIGEHLVAGKEHPNPEAIALLEKLAQDDSSDVQYSAVYHGLTQINTKSDEIVTRLIEVAATNREQGIYERIIQSLENNQAQVIQILDQKLATGNDITFYEIYEDFTGKKPMNADHYLDLPSSRPRMFIFKGNGADAEAFKADLEKALQQVGIENPELSISGVGENYVLLLKTYLTKNGQIVKNNFPTPGKFIITQEMWLTPKLEIQIESMKNK